MVDQSGWEGIGVTPQIGAPICLLVKNDREGINY